MGREAHFSRFRQAQIDVEGLLRRTSPKDLDEDLLRKTSPKGLDEGLLRRTPPKVLDERL